MASSRCEWWKNHATHQYKDDPQAASGVPERPAKHSPAPLRPVPRELAARLESLNPGYTFWRYGVDDDGSCFFHTLAAAIGLHDWFDKDPTAQRETGHHLRSLVNTALSDTSWNDYWTRTGGRGAVPSAATVRAKLSNPRTWSDVYMILYAMHQLSTGIVFFDERNNSRMYCGVHEPGGAREYDTYVMCLWVNHSHFEPVFAERNGILDTSFGSDHPIVRRVRERYEQVECPGAALAV